MSRSVVLGTVCQVFVPALVAAVPASAERPRIPLGIAARKGVARERAVKELVAGLQQLQILTLRNEACRVRHFPFAQSSPQLHERALSPPLAMATPSLQDVLCAVPALAVQIDAMTELSPGVASSPANVKELLRYLVEAGEYEPR